MIELEKLPPIDRTTTLSCTVCTSFYSSASPVSYSEVIKNFLAVLCHDSWDSVLELLGLIFVASFLNVRYISLTLPIRHMFRHVITSTSVVVCHHYWTNKSAWTC